MLYLSLYFAFVKKLSFNHYFNEEQKIKIITLRFSLIYMFSIYALTSIKCCGNLETDKGTAYREEAQK